jgi:hypothetical protein
MAPHGPKVSIVPGTEAGLDAITAFARATYGPHAHQALPAYYRWLYTENPGCERGLDHMLVAVEEGGAVVGFVNRMWLRWTVHGEAMAIPSIGDLALGEAQRKGGLGLRLVLAATRDVDHAFVNGSNPNSSPLFRGLKYQEVTGCVWVRALLRPVSAGLHHGLYRVLGRSRGLPDPVRWEVPAPYRATKAPDAGTMERMCALFNAHPAAVKPLWELDGFAWRFFHPRGPQHVLVHDETVHAAMLVSMGLHRGVVVARPIAWRCTDKDRFKPLLGAALALARSAGAEVFAGFTSEPQEAAAMEALGLRRTAEVPGTFFHHRRKAEADRFTDLLVQGAASDLGFDALRRVP